MKIFLENFRKSFILQNYLINPVETGPRGEEQIAQNEQKEKLSPEQQQVEADEAGMKYIKSYGDNLLKGLNKIAKNEDPQDPEFLAFQKNIKDKLEKLGAEFHTLKADREKLLAEVKSYVEANETRLGIEVTESGTVEKMKTSKEDLQTMKNIDFLKIPKSERLQHITKNNVDAERVASGEVKNLDFTFTFDGQYNKELFLQTTAGQVLPKEVGTVQAGGIEYTRSGLKGEFFNGNKRLTIHEGTTIEIPTVRTGKDIAEVEKGIPEKVEKLAGDEKLITLEALERDVDPEMVMDTFKKIIEKLPVEEKVVKLESLFTQVERVRGSLGVSKNDEALKNIIKGGELEAYTSNKGIDIDFSNLELRDGEKGLLDFISIYESKGNYEAYNSGTKGVVGGKVGHSGVKKGLIDMSLSEIIATSEKYSGTDKRRIFAAGKYQIIPTTLKAAAGAIGLSMNEKFSPENQDKLGLYLLKQKQFDSFMAGRISVGQFQNNLAEEWAAIPKISGKSAYHGAANRAGLSAGKMSSYLEKLRAQA